MALGKKSWLVRPVELHLLFAAICNLAMMGSAVGAVYYWAVGGTGHDRHFVPLGGSADLFPNGHRANLAAEKLDGTDYANENLWPVSLSPRDNQEAKNGRLPPGPDGAITITPTDNKDDAGQCKIRLSFIKDKLWNTRLPSEWITVNKWVVGHATLGDPGLVKIGTEKAVTVTLRPDDAPGLWQHVSFDLEEEMRHKCTVEGCTHGGEQAGIALLTDVTVGTGDNEIKVRGVSNGNVEMVAKISDTEVDRKSFHAVACPRQKLTGAEWHAARERSGFSSTKWGAFGVIDKRNPTTYNCVAHTMGLLGGDRFPWSTTVDGFDQLYRDNCSLKGYPSVRADARVYLYTVGEAPKHVALAGGCGGCSCTVTSKWGYEPDSYVFCHPIHFFGEAAGYGSVSRSYVRCTIEVDQRTTVRVGETKSISVSVKCGGDGMKGVKLSSVIAHKWCAENRGWDPGNETDAAGKTQAKVRGLTPGTAYITIRQLKGDWIQPPLADAGQIDVEQ